MSHNKSLAQDKIIDSLRNKLSKTKNINEIATLHLQLYKKQMRRNKDSSNLHLQKAIFLAKKQVNDSIKSKTLVYRIENLLHNNKYDSVFFYADKAIAMKENIKPGLMIDLFSMLGTAFYYKSEYVKAIEAHLKAEKLSDKNKIEEGKARVYNNIGIAYIKIKNWEKAEEYMNKSLEICKRFDIKRGIPYILGNLGIIYKNQDKYSEAIGAYQQSIGLNKEMNDSVSLSRNYSNIGTLYEFQKKYDLAIENYGKAIQIGSELNNISLLAINYHNMASVQNKLKNFSGAKKHYQLSLSLALELNSKDLLKNIYLGKSEMYENLNQFKDALKYRKEYEKWNDSLINTEHLSAISELEIKHETEKKEKDILVLNTQKLENEAALYKQQRQIRQLTVGLVGLALLFGTIFIIIRQNAKNKKQQELITAIADTQIEERKRIAQDLHDSVGGTLALAKNKLESLIKTEKGKSKEATQLLRTLQDTNEQIRQISHNIMPGELVKFGLVSAVQTTLDQIGNENLETHLFAHNLGSRIDKTKEIHLFRIVQEVVHNVLKHAQASRLDVHLNKYAKKLVLLIEDNGVGFSPNNTDGIGIQNIKNRVSYLKGQLNIDSSEGKGTTFNISVPL